MSTFFLFPSDCFSPKNPDESFENQFNAFKKIGCSVITANISDPATLKKTLNSYKVKDSVIIYRGWMMTPIEYQQFEEIVTSCGATLFTDSTSYSLCHYLPNWYPILQNHTPTTHITTDLKNIEQTINELNWSKYFIKDFVKSLKTEQGSTISDSSEIHSLVKSMKKYRGHIEGGLCIRQYVDLLPNSEIRFFVVNNQILSPLDSIETPQIVNSIKEKINSPFYSVDVALTQSGNEIIIEIGDGQVSDLVGWDNNRFATAFKNSLNIN